MPASPARSASPALARTLRVLLLALLAALALLPGASARADGGAEADAPVRLVIATAGLTWEDIDAESTPTLQCLADRSGGGAMNTTSTTVVSTKRQGLETLHTGYRGLAEEAPRTSGIPTPPTDQWEQLPGEVTETDDPAAVAGALQDGDVVELIAPSVPDHDDPSREQALTELDGAVAAALEELGGCEATDLPRTLLVLSLIHI